MQNFSYPSFQFVKTTLISQVSNHQIIYICLFIITSPLTNQSQQPGGKWQFLPFHLHTYIHLPNQDSDNKNCIHTNTREGHIILSFSLTLPMSCQAYINKQLSPVGSSKYVMLSQSHPLALLSSLSRCSSGSTFPPRPTPPEVMPSRRESERGESRKVTLQQTVGLDRTRPHEDFFFSVLYQLFQNPAAIVKSRVKVNSGFV